MTEVVSVPPAKGGGMEIFMKLIQRDYYLNALLDELEEKRRIAEW